MLTTLPLPLSPFPSPLFLSLDRRPRGRAVQASDAAGGKYAHGVRTDRGEEQVGDVWVDGPLFRLRPLRPRLRRPRAAQVQCPHEEPPTVGL